MAVAPKSAALHAIDALFVHRDLDLCETFVADDKAITAAATSSFHQAIEFLCQPSSADIHRCDFSVAPDQR